MSKKILTASATFVLMLSLFSTSAFAAAGTTNQSVNFRTTPSTSSKVISTLKPDTNIEILEKVNDYWLKVQVGSKIGYLDVKRVNYNQDIFTGNATISGYPNFRSAPSTSSDVYRNLKDGEQVRVLEIVNSYWMLVESSTGKGYVSTKYVTNYIVPAPIVPAPEQPQDTINDKVNDIIETGKKYYGTPYLYGAKSGSGYFDCSLFTQTIFKENNISLPRNSRQQSQIGTYVEKGNLKPGDLVFFSTRATVNKTGIDKIGHVGLYVGDGQMIHTAGIDGVKLGSMNTNWWTEHYITARRVIE